MSDIDDEVMREFLIEASENLDRLDEELLLLEKSPTRELLASIFRRVHTIKGTCGFLGLERLGSLTHAGENLLSKLRDGVLPVTRETTNALLKTCDAVRVMLVTIERTGQDGEDPHTELVALLAALAQGQSPPVASGSPESAPVAAPAAPPSAPVAAPPPAPLAAPPPPAPIAAAAPAPAVPAPPALEPPTAAPPKPAEPVESDAKGPAIADQSVRVDVGVLDRLMNLIGELVLARNQILQLRPSQEDAAFLAASQRLNLITTELQADVMKTRMQPISTVWSKYTRLVRDLAAGCGKDVRLELEGGDTELDRTILDAIKDPLTHVVRNAIDHGIEKPDLRAERGKPRQGRLRIRAYHEGGQVNIEISDDGGGVNVERVRARAVERGMLSADQAKRLTDHEVTGLIFLPGFSTAETVTNLSGRGVGMDVVKTNIERVGGALDVSSRQGHGMNLRIKIPLTLAIIPALIVWAGGTRYAIPQVSLLELVRLEAEQAAQAIEHIFKAPVYRLRGRLLPILRLDVELGLVPAELGFADAINIVVLQADNQQFGLLVDDISDTQEIVVKPLARALKRIPVFAGATILGDGTIALILDVVGLAQRAKVISTAQERRVGDANAGAEGVQGERHSLLMVGAGANGRFALPLSAVDRLEEFGPEAIEVLSGQQVAQYRGHVIPLIDLHQAVGAVPRTIKEDERQQVIIYQKGRFTAGLLVDRILDIVDDTLVVEPMGKRYGVLGSVVVQGRVTELLDLPAILQSVAGHLEEEAA